MKAQATQEWRKVPGISYEASSLGHVRRIGSERVLNKHGSPYPRVHCPGFQNHRGALVCVHVLVALAFLGEPPGPRGRAEGEFCVNHKNGIKHDNRPENLEWVSTSENHRHAFRTGLRVAQRGERRPMAKLTDERVRAIRQRYAAGGVSQLALAHEYGVTDMVISKIVRRLAWKHVA